MIRVLARLAGIAGVVLALDQWTKHWATRTLQFQRPVEVIGEFVRFTYTRNSGVAFGLGAGLPFPYWIFSVAAVVVILWLIVRGRVPQLPRQIALALILGGAVGNLIDRITTGEVVDFIEIGYGRWHWPVFNLADSAVTIGVVLFAMSWPRSHETEVLPEASAPPGGAQDPDHGSIGADRESGGTTGSLPRPGSGGPLA